MDSRQSCRVRWFFANDATTLPVLAEPLCQAARAAIPQACDGYTMVPLDWSNLHLAGHAARVELAHHTDLGYELLTGPAKRLTVAAMACVVVWKLARDPSPAAAELRQALVRLSGRQIIRGEQGPVIHRTGPAGGPEIIAEDDDRSGAS